jgi:endonuclease-3
MTRAKKIAEILEKLYPNPPIPLQHKNAYELLVAVLLSASCTDERVNKTTPKLFRLADTPEKMATLDPEEVRHIIHSLGLSKAKSKNIVALSKIIVEKHRGRVPRTFDELEDLPGVGHKTASVVMSQAFNVPAFPVDTHIFRCARRWGLSKGKTVAAVERDLKKAFPRKLWNKVHLQIIYFAREHCRAVKHHKEKCPICSLF